MSADGIPVALLTTVRISLAPAELLVIPPATLTLKLTDKALLFSDDPARAVVAVGMAIPAPIATTSKTTKILLIELCLPFLLLEWMLVQSAQHDLLTSSADLCLGASVAQRRSAEYRARLSSGC